MFCTQYNLILQASVCPLVCVPEEYTMRGEVRGEEVADLLAPLDPNPGAAAEQLVSLGLGPGRRSYH